MYLGDLTDELHGRHITEYASSGPKSYCYKLNSVPNEEGEMVADTVTKCKGFTLNWKNSGVINFDTMADLVKNHTEQRILTTFNPYTIKRDKKTSAIRTVEESKKYSFVYTKRRIVENFDTEPYGF